MPTGHRTYIASDLLPLQAAPGLFWLGGCSDSGSWPGGDARRQTHEHLSAWLIHGDDKTMLIDTGHFAHWWTIEGQLEQALQGRSLDYILPSHQEIPHSGNLGRLMSKYPEAVAVGDVSDYHLFFPEIDRSRLVTKVDGDRIDIGGSELVVLDPIWRDLSTTMWAYDTRLKALFPADGLGYSHDHEPEVCGLTAEQLPAGYKPYDEWRFMLPFIGMKFQSTLPGIAAYRELLKKYPVEIICSAHGSPMTTDVAAFTEIMLDVIAVNKSSM